MSQTDSELFAKQTLLPSDVHKQVLCRLVDVEDFIPEQTEASGALQSQLPQRQGRGVAVQHRVAQNETNCRENREQGHIRNTASFLLELTELWTHFMYKVHLYLSWVHRHVYMIKLVTSLFYSSDVTCAAKW